MLIDTTERQAEKLAYSVEEASQTTSLSKAFLRKEIRAGRLKAKFFGRRILVLDENLKEYLALGRTKQ